MIRKSIPYLLSPAPADGGSAVLDLDKGEFEATIRAGVKTLVKDSSETKSAIQKVTADLDRADKEVKTALEELTKVKNTCNDFDAVLKKMEKVQKAVALNARSSFRSPIEKACADPHLNLWLNAIGRMGLVRTERDYMKLPADMRKALEDGNAELKSLTGVDSSLGQATVPQQTFNEIYDTLLEYGQWSTLGVQRVGMRTTVLPVATARPAFYWIGSGTGGSGETTAITEGSFTGGSVTLSIQTLAAYVTVARELLADSTVDLAPYIMRQLAESVAQGLDTAAFIADSTANQTYAGYTGIFCANSDNVQMVKSAAAGNTTTAATQLEDWIGVLTQVSAQVLSRNAKWWIHPQVLANAALIRDKNGRPLFQTWLEVPNPGSIGSILGYPVIPTAIAPTTANTTAGSAIAVFGDPDGCAIGIRQDLELATSDDIKFAENMRAFRALMRAGVKIKTVAASTTLKPFCVLKTAAQ